MLTTAALIDGLRAEIGDFRFIFRAGVWKPRTSPNSFQGAGEEALGWLNEVRERYGVPVGTEVATPEHVRMAVNAGIEYLWIGARTSANPIAVQEIARQIKQETEENKNALRGVLIKNPVNADPALWLGNIERVEEAGVPVMVIHRGCNHRPCWSMAHVVRQARPDIPMLLDPSHMSGDAARVPELLNQVAALGLDGAMIEVHCSPETALSDKAQQVTPSVFGSWLSAEGHTPTTDMELAWLRAEIDELDDQLWDTIAARMDVSKRIGEWKKAHRVSPLQPERYQQIVERIKKRGERLGLPEEFTQRVWDIIHEQSLKQQE